MNGADQLHAIIIGGSLGGLFAAHMLRLAGLDVQVFERAGDDLASRGAGIGTHPEMFDVLKRIGVRVDESIGVKVDARICLDLAGRPIAEDPGVRTMSAWAHVYQPLKDLMPEGTYHFDKSLTHVVQDAGGVTATFADGTVAHGDLLIGADGIRSTVRELLMPEAQPRYAGYVAWRGVVQESDFPPDLHAELFSRYVFCIPEGEIMLAFPVPGRGNDIRPGRRGYNFVWYHPVEETEELPRLCTDTAGRCHGTAIPPPLIRPEVIAEMRAAAHRLVAPQIARVVDLVPQPFFQAIFDLESQHMVKGRIALLGDAAFVGRPHVGMGVTKAALDAQSLADEIVRAAGDLDLALKRYDASRVLFGSRLVTRARRLGAHVEAQKRRHATSEFDARYQPPEFVLREHGAKIADIPELSPLSPRERGRGEGIDTKENR